MKAIGCLLLAACGRIGFDPVGGAGDATGMDSTQATITVRTVGVSWVASPLPGTTIVISDATGAMQSSFVSTGVDVVPIQPGWMVSAVSSGTVEVVQDVQQGDVIEFGQTVSDARTPTATMTVMTSVSGCTAITPCGEFFSATSAITLDQYAGCPDAFDMLVLQGNANYAVVPVPTFGGTATANVTMIPNLSIMVTNNPVGNDLDVNQSVVYAGNSISGNGGTELVAPAQVTFPLTGEVAFGDHRYVEADTRTTQAEQQVFQQVPISSSAATIDLSINQLPTISGFAFDVDARTASFPTTVAATFDATVWQLQGPAAVWWIVAPPTQSIVLPVIPAVAFDHGDMIAFNVSLVDGNTWTGYADVKAVPVWRIAVMLEPFVGVDATTILTSVGFATVVAP